MSVPIKFRGRDIDSGEFVYGDLIHDDAGVLIFNGHYYRVDKESVAQLVGYDKNGRKVYEGDIVTDKNGRELTASLVAAGTDSKGFHFKWDKDFELKEKK